MDTGVQHCEERYLDIARQYDLCQPDRVVMTLEDTLRSQSQLPSLMVGKPLDYSDIARALLRYMEVIYPSSVQICYCTRYSIFATSHVGNNSISIECKGLLQWHPRVFLLLVLES